MYNSTIYDFLKINRKRTNNRLSWSVICLMFLTFTTIRMKAQNVNIPDPNFKAYLVGHAFINTNGDDEISIEEATNFYFSISCNNLQISNLTGIEAFVNISGLSCSGNQLIAIDVSQNTSLTQLICNDNQLTSLNVKNGNNINFGWFNSTNNPYLLCIEVDDADYSTTNWTNIDSQTTFSEDCNYPISCVINIPDVAFKNYLINNHEINTNGDDEIQCDEAQAFTGTINCNNLNISNLKGIEAFVNFTGLNCADNQLTNLDISYNTLLINLNCSNNQLTKLKTSSNTTLEDLKCYSNQITHFDVSSNVALTYFDCNSNQLTSLIVKNGNNTSLTYFNSTNNVELACIEVDDADYSTTNWTNIDSQTTFSEDCNYPISCVINIPDVAFKNYLINNHEINTNGDDEIQCDEAETFAGEINVFDMNISNLSGIEAFINITQLNCQLNNLTNLDISNNIALTLLDCSFNQLTSLDLSNNTALISLYCHQNQLTILDVNNNNDLEFLNCHFNLLTSLNISNKNFLTELICTYNPLTDLVLINNNTLTSLDCSYNQLTSLDLSNKNNNALTSLDCSFNILTSLNISNNLALTYLNCAYNQLTNLDVSNNTNIEYLYCSNPLTNLDVSNNIALKELDCRSHITSLDVSNNIYLEKLDCSIANEGFYITNLNVSNNIWLKYLNVNGQQLTSLDVTNNLLLTKLNCTENQLTNLDVSNNTFLETLLLLKNQLFNLDVSNNTNLTTLECSQNQLTSLDLSNNTALTDLSCVSNQLALLNVKNRNNHNVFYMGFFAFGNPNLTCIEVDDATYSTENWIYVDTWVTFAENCGYVYVNDFSATTNFSFYPNPVNDVLYFSSNSKIEKVVISNILGQQMSTNLNSDNTILDMSNLPSGNYFVRITIEEIYKTIKIIKN